MDPMKLWFTENLSLITISILIIAMIGVMIWRSRVPRAKGGGGTSYKSEINIISAITLVLIVTTLFLSLKQQNLAAIIEIGIVVLIYAFFRGRISDKVGGRNGSRGVVAANNGISSGGVKDVITAGHKRLYLYKVFKSKQEANNCIKSMKNQYGNDYAFQKRSRKTAEKGVVWGVYSDLC